MKSGAFGGHISRQPELAVYFWELIHFVDGGHVVNSCGIIWNEALLARRCLVRLPSHAGPLAGARRPTETIFPPCPLLPMPPPI